SLMRLVAKARKRPERPCPSCGAPTAPRMTSAVYLTPQDGEDDTSADLTPRGPPQRPPKGREADAAVAPTADRGRHVLALAANPKLDSPHITGRVYAIPNH